MRRVAKGLLAMAVALAGAVAAPSAAGANAVCGQVITANFTLTHDLSCAGTALVVGASNVVLDLGGRTISGPQTSGGPTAGVRVQSNRTDVTVRNGVVRGFDAGVDVASGAHRAIVKELVLRANGLGVRITTGASNGLITLNEIRDTTRFSAVQLGGDGHIVESNVMRGGAGAGVFLAGNGDRIAGNVIEEMGASGISISAFPGVPGPFVGNQILRNVVTGSSRVFTSASISVVNGSATVVADNVVVGRLGTPGVFLQGSSGSTVTGNVVNLNNEGILLRSSTNTRARANVAEQNRVGIRVESGSTGTEVTGNRTSANFSDGIVVLNSATTVTANEARNNGNWGIFAVAGTADGGANKASGNGQPAQCANIACSP